MTTPAQPASNPTAPAPAASAPGELASKYTPSEVEAEIYQRWLSAKAFHAEPGGEKGQGPRAKGQGAEQSEIQNPKSEIPNPKSEIPPSSLRPCVPSSLPYSIFIPPPNVTAALHMGHALNNTLQDILTRWHRMLGDNTMWMPGTDHAGIATQTIVDKRLQAEGKPALSHYKQLEAEGKGGREQFIAKVEEWKDEYEARITNQLKMMGCSCDWDRQRFTMDEVCAAAVREAFFQLFKDGLIYRGKRLVNWDPVTQTALADDEVEMEEIDGHFYYLKYPVVDAAGVGSSGPATSEPPAPTFITVATTRPETMLGDTAVAINPKDPRAAALRGKFVRLPIVNRVIPIIEDDYVVMPAAAAPTPSPAEGEGGGEGGASGDPKAADAKMDPKALFATGFLKVTPAHDPNDYDIGRRHEKELGAHWLINVMAPDASISRDHGWPASEWDSSNLKSEISNAKSEISNPKSQIDPFAHTLLGKSREDARKMIVDWFRAHDLLEDVKPYKHSVGHSYRSHVPVEPYLSDQWYVKVTDDRLRGAALRAMARDQFDDSSSTAKAQGLPSLGFGEQPNTSENQLRFYPQRYAKTFQQWHENIRDWCISRQLWWGHRIPVWYIRFEYTSVNPHSVDAIYAARRKRLDQLQAALDRYSAARGQSEEFFVRSDDEMLTAHVCTRSDEADQALDYIWTLRRSLQLRLVDESRSHPVPTTIKLGNEATSAAAFDIANTLLSCSRDPDVLDTWFSSGLWPLSTLGWPDPSKFPAVFPQGEAALNTWNPSNLLCTAREIITLWVSRMVMFNIYFRGCVPFKDVFIHAMIQDGHGQKMSKTLGNGIDPLDIIHSHGSDAMRFTLTGMTTQTQDVRMTVELVCPHCGETFSPKFVSDKAGHMVAAPMQDCPAPGCKKKMASSYGVSSGKVKSTAEAPVARNTSEKFDYGRNFANKLWNAVRFALSNIEAAKPRDGNPWALPSDHWALPGTADQWILARLARTIESTTASLQAYEFKGYADGLYDFIWRDFCDWYIEAIKPTVATDTGQQRVLVTVIDVILRLLHPSMPYITEKLWERLNIVAPPGGRTDITMDGLVELKLNKAPASQTPARSDLLIKAAWPTARHHEENAAKTEARFESLRQIVSAIREVRTTYKVPPRQKVACSIKTAGPASAELSADLNLIATLANVDLGGPAGTGPSGPVRVGPHIEKPADAAAATVAGMEIYLHSLIDAGAEKTRLTKRVGELEKSIAAMTGRLSNKSYTDKAPAKLVQETRDQLAAAEKELAAVKAQVAGL